MPEDVFTITGRGTVAAQVVSKPEEFNCKTLEMQKSLQGS
jgi:hypothetical protein